MMTKTTTSKIVMLGEWFFKHRDWTPIPFMLLLLLVTAHQSRVRISWPLGLTLIVLGEGVRLWSVAVIGKESRTRGSGAARLVRQGPYAYVRNPLYVGNFLLTLGATFLSELLWMIPIAMVLYAVQYVPVVLWEEDVLAERFGAQYAAYRQQVPRWIPRWRPQIVGASEANVRYQWRAALWSERSTFATLAVLLFFMVVKEDLRHLPKYLRKHFPHASTLPI